MKNRDIDKLLEEREKTHGDYAEHAAATQGMIRMWSVYKNWKNLSDCQKESLHMFAHKIGRILTGDPDVNDHWDDIAGYAKLVSQRIPGKAASFKVNSMSVTGFGGGGSYSAGKRTVEINYPGTPEDGGHYARLPENNE